MQERDLCFETEDAKPLKSESNRFASLGVVGAVISAILASLCCAGPFVLIMLGAGGAWTGNLRAFEPYRLIFILFTIGFLGAGFYSVYKKPKEDCSLCEVPQTKKVRKIVFWTATILAAFLLGIPYLMILLA